MRRLPVLGLCLALLATSCATSADHANDAPPWGLDADFAFFIQADSEAGRTALVEAFITAAGG